MYNDNKTLKRSLRRTASPCLKRRPKRGKDLDQWLEEDEGVRTQFLEMNQMNKFGLEDVENST